MTEATSPTAEILAAIAAVDLVNHPLWEFVRARYSRRHIFPDGGIYVEPEDVTITGDRFTVDGAGIGLEYTYLDMPDQDFMSIIITGRFEDGKAIIETIVRAPD